MAVLAVEKLSKLYDTTHELAVRSVSFTVSEGEFMVLLGPSGCGKTSILRMIAGLEPVTSGTVSIDGKVINRVPAKDRDIAMVFQSYALYPHMSVYDNLAFGLRRRGFQAPEIERRVQAVATTLGLTPFLRRRPHALSGGQRQRVALGRAIVREPQVFLFDEPLSNLDAAQRVTTRNELIKQHHELGTTTVYVTHDQVEAMTMGDRICVMNHGEVAQIGCPTDIYRHPADLFVARFLGSPQMNLFQGTLTTENEDTILCQGPVRLNLGHRMSPAVAGHRGATVTAGVRPEDLYESPPPGFEHRIAPLAVRVLAVEPLGAETHLMLALATSGEELIARVGRETDFRTGDQTTIFLDTSAIHLFDPVTTRAIL